MPRRTNLFQRVITEIEASLASESSTVTESALLEDSATGEEREVDILIEQQVSGYPIKIAVECRSHKRRADVTWIEQLHTKYIHLPVNQVVAISRTGFTKAAKKKAESLKIITMTWRDVKKAEWKDIALDASVGMSHTLVKLDHIYFRFSKEHEDSVADLNDEWKVFDSQGHYLGTTETYGKEIKKDPELWEKIDEMVENIEQSQAAGTKEFGITASLNVDLILRDALDNEYPTDRIIAPIEVTISKPSRKSEHSYRDKRVFIDLYDTELEGPIKDIKGWATIVPSSEVEQSTSLFTMVAIPEDDNSI